MSGLKIEKKIAVSGSNIEKELVASRSNFKKEITDRGTSRMSWLTTDLKSENSYPLAEETSRRS